MIFTDREKALVGVLLLIAAFATGRWTVSPKTEIKTVTVTQEVKDTHTRTTKTETKKPDGTDISVTTTDEVSKDREVMTSKSDTKTSRSTLNISVLGAEDFSRGLSAPTYGLSVSKEAFGPVTIGAFGLMNGTIGLSIGVNF